MARSFAQPILSAVFIIYYGATGISCHSRNKPVFFHGQPADISDLILFTLHIHVLNMHPGPVPSSPTLATPSPRPHVVTHVYTPAFALNVASFVALGRMLFDILSISRILYTPRTHTQHLSSHSLRLYLPLYSLVTTHETH